MSNLQERVRRIRFGKRLILAIFSAFLTAISMPGMLFSVFVWFGIVPLFFALKDDKTAGSFFTGWIFGIFYMGISTYWLLPTLVKNIALFNNFPPVYGFVAFILFTIIEGVFFGIFGFFYTYFEKRSKKVPLILHILSMASIFVLIEFLRGYGQLGFTGSRLSDALYDQIAPLQLVSITGTFGLTFVIFAVNYLFYIFLRKKDFKVVLLISILVGSTYLASFLYPRTLPFVGKRITIGVVQPNITVSERYKMSPYEIFDVVKWGIDNLATKTNLIFFPEGTFESEIGSIYPDLKDLMARKNVNAIIGYPSSKDGKIYNSAGLFDRDGLKAIYSKHILVPFTETLPYPQIFGIFGFLKLANFFTPGKNFTIFKVDNLNFATDICFESYFGWLSRRFTNKGAQFIVTITDDSWFDQRTALIQHFAQSVMRAVENRKWVVQVADTGITGLVNPYGQIVKELPTHQKIASVLELYPNNTKTFYDKFGDMILWISLGLLICESIFLWRRF